MEYHVVPLAAQEERSTALSRKSRLTVKLPDRIACSAAHPEPNEKARPQAKAMQVTNGEMVIVERSSSLAARGENH